MNKTTRTFAKTVATWDSPVEIFEFLSLVLKEKAVFQKKRDADMVKENRRLLKELNSNTKKSSWLPLPDDFKS